MLFGRVIRLAGRVGGAAIPGGVMMISGKHAGVAIVDYLDCVHAASFDTVENTIKIPGLRGIASLGCSLMTMVKGMIKAEELRTGAEGEDPLRLLAPAGILIGSAAYSLGMGALFENARKKLGKKTKNPAVTAGLNAAEALSAIAPVLLLAVTPAGKEVRGFHGAEHKTVHCADKGIPPIPENAYRESRIHPRCGTSLAVTAELFFLAGCTLVTPFIPEKWQPLANDVLMTASMAAAYEGLMKKGDGAFGKLGALAQKFTTAEPDTAMLEAASAAIYAALEPDERS